MVLIAELFVDWVKHAFITRFNEIPADIYREYTLTLAYDLIASKQKYVSHLQLTYVQELPATCHFLAQRRSSLSITGQCSFHDIPACSVYVQPFGDCPVAGFV